MGQAASSLERTGNKPSNKVKQRVQLLEELVQAPSEGRRQQVLKQLTADSSIGHSQSGYFLPSAPEEFKLGCLIAAGSYGRVYAGTYCGHPAALKLLILDEESAAAIVNEVRLCLKLNHKNLVRLLDCAVVSTSRQHGSSQDALGTGWLSMSGDPHVLQPSNSSPYSYLPLVGDPVAAEQQQTGSLQAANASTTAAGGSVIARAVQEQFALLTGNDLLYFDAQQQQQQHLGLTTAAGHACFEVWIAMELCDGGTLAEQVKQGFQYNPATRQVDMEVLLSLAIDIARALSYMHAEHVCHGDLKSENVLLKSVGPSSFDGSIGCAGSTCWGSSDDCSWLSMLCSTASSTTCTHSCRRHSSDSCFSGCTRSSGNGAGSAPAAAVSGGWLGSCMGCSSTSSSPSSSPILAGAHGSSSRNAVSRSGSILSLSLAGLCCMAQPSACVREGNDDQDQPAGSSGAAASCFCGSDPATVNDHNEDGACGQLYGTAAGTQDHHLGHDGMGSTAAAVLGGYSISEPPINSGEVSCIFPATGGSPLHQQPQSVLPMDSAMQQLALVGALQAGHKSWLHSREAGDAGEEEHIAPLSLYTTAREHRRSRRLSQTALLPSMQVAIAAAAARHNMPSLPANQMHAMRRPSSSNAAANLSSSEDGEDASSSDSVSEGLLQQQQQAPGSQASSQSGSDLAAAAGESSAAGSRQETTASHCSSDASSPRSSRLLAGAPSASGSMATVVEAMPATEKQQRLCLISSGLDVYAQRLPSRSRRHSYCSGSSFATRDALGLLAFATSTTAAPISAAEAATAIAAAAEAVKEEWRAALPPRRGKRSRRMSCDDRLLLQRAGRATGLAGSLKPPGLLSCTGSGDAHSSKSAFGLVSGLGRAPAALRRTGSGGTAQQKGESFSLAAARGMCAPAASRQLQCSGSSSSSMAASLRRTRRHSWAGLGVACADASGPWNLRSLTSLLLPQDQQQQRQQHAEEAAVWLLGDAEQQQEQPEEEPDQQRSVQSVLSSTSGQYCSGCSIESAAATAARGAGSRRSRRMSAAPAFGMPVSDGDAEEEFCAAAVPCLPVLGKPRSGRRARRHSWAGFGYEQMAAPIAGRRSALRALSSCFAPELLQDMFGSDSLQVNTGSQTPRRSHHFHLASCCGDASHLPSDDAAAAAADEVQQPLLSGSCHSTDQVSDIGGAGCFPSRLLSSGSGAGGSRSTKGSSRRSSWCCSSGAGASAQDVAFDLAVTDSSTSMTALLPHASFEPAMTSVTSTPCMPVRAGACTALRGRPGRTYSGDELRSYRAFEGASSVKISELKALEAQMQQQQERPQQDGDICGLPAGWSVGSVQSSTAGPCFSTSSNQETETPADKPEHMVSWEVSTAVHDPAGDSAPTTDLHSSAALNSTPRTCESAATHLPSAAAAAPAEAERVGCTLPTGAENATPDNSGAALHPSTTAPASPRCTSATGVDAGMGVRRMSRRLDTLDTASACDAGSPGAEQLSVGCNLLFRSDADPSAAAAAAAAGPVVAAPEGASSSSNSSSGFVDVMAESRGCANNSKMDPATLLRGDTFGSWLSQAQQAQLVQQQQMQVQMEQQPAPLTLAAALAAATAASTAGKEALQRVSPPQPFTGSFGLKQTGSSRRCSNTSSILSASGLPQESTAAAAAPGALQREPVHACARDKLSSVGTLSVASQQTCSSDTTAMAAGRGRRWSTGVAAHALLLRKQSLLPSPCSQQNSNIEGVPGSSLRSRVGSAAGSPISSIRCRVSLTSQGADGSVASSLADMQQLGDAALTAGTAAAAANARSSCIGSLGSSTDGGRSGQPLRPGSPAGSIGGASVHSSCPSHVVNVLGIPQRPTNVLAQRRLSYDTATGAYMLVDRCEPSRFKQQLEQQQQQPPVLQQPLSLPELLQQQPEQQQQTTKVATTQLQQLHSPALVQQSQQSEQQQQSSPQELQQVQQVQAQMQRLVEALAKKGYTTSFGDSGSSPWSGSVQPQSPAQQQQQQQGSGHVCLSSSAAAAASALQQPQMVPNYNSGCVPLSRPRYTAKVCDFGFSQCLRAGQSHCSTAAAGTITHQAPEVLRSGHLSPAADIYAFGIILWELLTGERPFRGLLEGDLVVGVCERGLRPTFPPGAPAAYVALAQQCWAQEAAERPSAEQLLKRLNELLYDTRRAKAMQHSSSTHSCSGSNSSKCRQRRHSMPVVGSSTRKRRMSRRLSLFLPFSRQPAVVPEHAPLEQQLPSDAPASTAPTAATRTALAAAGAAAATAAVPAVHISSGRDRSCSGGSSSGSHLTSASGHAVRLRDLKNGTMASSSGNTTDSRSMVAMNASGAMPGEVAAAAGEGSQWFKSFDD